MKTPHKHAALIKAWADGAEIEFKHGDGRWVTVFDPSWNDVSEYRIKPEPKPDVVYFACFDSEDILGKKLMLDTCVSRLVDSEVDELKLTFDGETGKLKAAEVL